MAPSLGRCLAALGLSDGSLESKNMTRVQITNPAGGVYFDSSLPSSGMSINWNALLLEAARGELAMWQGELSDSPVHDDGSGLMERSPIDELLAYLLERGALINSPNEEGDRPLAVAAQRGSEDVVQTLLDHGADPTINHRDGFPVLLQAVRAGHQGIVRLMLERVPDESLVGSTIPGRALNYAAFNGDMGMLQTLLDSGLAIDTPHHRQDSTALIRTAVNGHHAAMHFLLDRGADVNFRDRNGFTPLLLALNQRQEQSAGLLIGRGADVNGLSSEGVSPLMLTARFGTVAMARLLLERGAEVDAQHMSNGWTAVMSAATNGKWAVMDLLVEAGAQMDAVNHAGASARTLAVDALGPTAIDIMRADGMAELTGAIDAGLFSLMSALLEISATDSPGQNDIDWGKLMSMGLQGGSLLLMRELLTAVARIDAENFPALIAQAAELSLEAEEVNWEMLDLLREFGADIHAPAVETNTTLLDLAVNAEINQVTNEVAQQMLENEANGGTIQAALQESMQIALQESIQVALQELVQGPVQATIQANVQAAIQAAIQAVIQETAQHAIQSVVQAAIQATTQVPNAVAMDGLLNAPLAYASQRSNTEVEAIVELFLSTELSPAAAVPGNVLEVQPLTGDPIPLDALSALSDLEQGRDPEVEAASDDHGDHDLVELSSTGDANMAADLDSTYSCCTPIFENVCQIMPILLGAGIGLGANYYLGQLHQGWSLDKSLWDEYSVFGS